MGRVAVGADCALPAAGGVAAAFCGDSRALLKSANATSVTAVQRPMATSAIFLLAQTAIVQIRNHPVSH